MTSKELRDHAAAMLKSIAADLGNAQSREEEIAKSRGMAPRTPQTSTGEDHGIARMGSKFTIEQLVSEYRALRASVLRLWSESGRLAGATDFGDIVRFDEAIDQLLAASVLSFSRATREAMDAEKARKDQFLAMLAHELRNPLSPISAAATLLKVAKSDTTVISNASNIIARQVTHMATLVDDLLDVSRVTRGAIELKLEPLDLRQVIDDAVEQVQPQMQAKQQVLAVTGLSGPVNLQGDRKRLVQVLSNLLTNAAKYTQPGGRISLHSALDGDQVAIAVEDNGIGMAPDFVPHVFDLFVQAERSSDRSSGGLGLGLALVKSLAELHEGKVSCSSPGLGKGSRFTVWLPIRTGEDSNIERRRAPRIETDTLRQLKIMVVDDNVDAASTLAMLLESTGYDVAVTHRAREALDRSRVDVPDVFLPDIGMPDINGNELARQLRAQAETSHAVLIALTGYDRTEDRDQTRAAGFDHHLIKPVDTQKLYTLLSNVHSPAGED